MDFIIEKLGLALSGDNTELSFVDDSEEPKSDEPKGDEPKSDEPKSDEPKDSDESDEEESDEEESKGDEPKSDESKDSNESDEEESDEDDESKGGGSEEDESDEDESEESDEEESDEEGSKGDEDESEESKDDEDESEESNSSDEEESDESKGDESKDPATDEGLDLDKLLEELESGENGLLSSNEALSQGFKDPNNTTQDEQDWRPWSTTGDRVVDVPSYQKDEGKVAKVERALKPVVAAIRASFRNRFLQSRQPVIRHGVRRGEELSERLLVDTFIEVKSGKAPARPWQRTEPANAESLAIAVVGDQSGSMSGSLARHAALGMFAIASAFDALGSPILCVGVEESSCSSNGFQSRPDEVVAQEGGWLKLRDEFHRVGSVQYNVFKGWDERLKGCSGRFLNYNARGSTPLEDGIQFALDELTKRKERHRIVLVITDGLPDSPKVVRRQVRLAKEAGIHVVGVGIGPNILDLHNVVELFQDHVVVTRLEELPKVLLRTVEGLVFPSQSKKAKISCGVKK